MSVPVCCNEPAKPCGDLTLRWPNDPERPARSWRYYRCDRCKRVRGVEVKDQPGAKPG